MMVSFTRPRRWALFAVVLAAMVLLAPGARADFLPPPGPVDVDPNVQLVLNCWSYGHKLASKTSTAGMAGEGLVCLHGEGKPQAVAAAARMITNNEAKTLVVWQRAVGDLAGGAALAALILDRRMTVLVDGPCVGTCVWWFLAGAKRLLTPDARLDFAGMPPLPPDLAQRLGQEAAVDVARLTALATPNTGAPNVGATLPSAADLKGLGLPVLFTPVVAQPKNDE